MERIELNVQTGEVSVIPLTAEEIAKAQLLAASIPPQLSESEQLVSRVIADPVALAALKAALS
jgi:hypothetical protein